MFPCLMDPIYCRESMCSISKKKAKARTISLDDKTAKLSAGKNQHELFL